MQQMLEWVRKTLPMDLDTPRMIENKIESLLKVEKDNIMNAYVDGFLNDKGETALQYYNETYNNETDGK